MLTNADAHDPNPVPCHWRTSGPILLASDIDVIGPVCPLSYSFVEGTDCAADPAVLPIGVTYADVAGPKPTGPAITSTAIRLVLLTAALQSGTYHLADSGSWRSASDTSTELHPVAITIDFTVTGPT